MEEPTYLEEGKLVVFRRGERFHARFHVGPRQYVWRSLKTSNREVAIREATKQFHRFEYKIEQGHPISSKSLNDVIDSYISMRTSRQNIGPGMLYQVKRVSKFWREFAGHRDVDMIGDKELRQYVSWRRDYYHGKQALPVNAKINPTDKTIQFDIGVGRSFLRYATDKGWREEKACSPSI